MPIYAYKCTACGHTQDVLRKISDPPLTQCTACAAEAFAKQVTAAGFQLKGSGWYVTDFRGGEAGKASDGANSGVATEGNAAAKSDAPSVQAATAAAPAPAATPAASAPAASPAAAPKSAPKPAPKSVAAPAPAAGA